MQLTLNQDIQMPMIGFGTYLITNDDAHSVVLEALRAGYRHIDTAEGYGNEEGVGLAIQAGRQELGLSREDIFVTTKLWPGNLAWGQPVKTYQSTIDSLNQSLSNLKLDYVDLYLIHGPFAEEQRLEQWKAFVKLRQMGKTRAIGVSNFNITHIEEIKSAGLPLPDANQIELHPWSQKPELTSYLVEHGIAIIAYSSLVPLSTWRTAPGQDSAKTEAMRQAGDKADSPFKIMAQKYGISEAQILLRWALQKGYAILPKSMNKTRIRQNFDALSFEIDEADMTAIEKMDRGEGVAWSFGDPIKVS
jgi:2,5-diketo-D-gluconate reductase A